MILIALGANQDAVLGGDTFSPSQSFVQALEILQTYHKVDIVAVSGLWESPAWPDPLAQPAYKNAVAQISTNLSAETLLILLKQVEQDFGREAAVRNAPRPLDLDILDYNGRVLETQNLTLPHPRMCARGFVLLPLQEIAPNWRDPIKNRAIMDWIARLELCDVTPLKWLGPFV